MIRRHSRAWSLVALTVATLLILLGVLVGRVGRPYPGFFVAPDFRVFPSSPAAAPECYMCLWAVSNVAVPESVLGSGRFAAAVVGFVSVVLSVHGWVFFLTYPANPPREAWLERHRVIPQLYAGALLAGGIASVSFVALATAAPGLFVDGWIYPASVATLFTFAAVSFPIKIAALLDTRRGT